jgi:hypothetical protein
VLALGSDIAEHALFSGACSHVRSHPSRMMHFNPYNLLAGFIFGTLGWGAFIYGRKLELWQPRAIGLGLMLYPYFISNSWLLWGFGVGLLVLLWFYHHE